MTEETEHTSLHEHAVPFYRRSNIVIFITSSIIIAFMLVSISMALYNSSGAAQLDLSRPGYKSVQDQVDRTDNFESFPATGTVTSGTLDQFQKLYNKQVKPVDNMDAFSSAPLEDQALGIDTPSSDN